MSSHAQRASSNRDRMLAILKELETEGDIKNSFIETLKTTAVGLIGAAIGSRISRPSLLLGLGTIMASNYYKSTKGMVLGVGMIAGGSLKLAKGLQGNGASGIAGIQESVKAIGDDLKERLYLDKIFSSKSSQPTDGLKGVGEVQYFNPNEVNMGSLDAIEDEIARSSMQFNQKEFAGTYDDISGVEERIL